MICAPDMSNCETCNFNGIGCAICKEGYAGLYCDEIDDKNFLALKFLVL